MAINEGPFGDYTGILAGAGVTKATMATAFTNLLALIPQEGAQSTNDSSGETPTPHPEFDAIPQATANLLRAEINAMAATVAAA